MAMFVYVLAYFITKVIVSLTRIRFRTAIARKGGPQVITLNLGPLRTVPRSTLCTRCMFSHIVAGYEPQERIVFCGYAFPLREVLFPVKECTDFRTERPVSMEVLPLDETAAQRQHA